MLEEVDAKPLTRKPSKKKIPKKMSGYQFFLRACLDEMKAQYPEASIVLSAVSKLCAENWQSMGAQLRQRFHDEAAAVNNSAGRGSVGKVMKPKPKRTYRRKPMPAFKIYCRDRRVVVRRNYPQLNKLQIESVLSNEWNTCDELTRMVYEQKSKWEFQKYEMERIAGDKGLSAKQEEEKVEEAVEMEDLNEEENGAEEDEGEEMQA